MDTMVGIGDCTGSRLYRQRTLYRYRHVIAECLSMRHIIVRGQQGVYFSARLCIYIMYVCIYIYICIYKVFCVGGSKRKRVLYIP